MGIAFIIILCMCLIASSLFILKYNIKKNTKVQDIKLTWEKVRIRQGWYLLKSSSNDYFSIEDYSESGDYKGPMKFKSEDADKLLRFLNSYHKGQFTITHWKIYDRLQKQLSLNGGVYARNFKQELKSK